MEYGADPNAMDRRGVTAKDYCCRACYDCADKCKLIQGILIILILELIILEKIDILLSKVWIWYKVKKNSHQVSQKRPIKVFFRKDWMKYSNSEITCILSTSFTKD